MYNYKSPASIENELILDMEEEYEQFKKEKNQGFPDLLNDELEEDYEANEPYHYTLERTKKAMGEYDYFIANRDGNLVRKITKDEIESRMHNYLKSENNPDEDTIKYVDEVRRFINQAIFFPD